MTMRIGMMTFLHNNNYGSTLQAWALQQVLTNLGCDAEYIDYHPSQKEKVHNLLKNGNSPKLILEGMKKRHPGDGTSAIQYKKAALDRFRKEHLQLTAVCRNEASLAAKAADYDLLLAGSDQIWSPEWLNTAYYLDFAGKTPRASYASSLGVRKLPAGYKQRKIRRCLEGYRAVSVREAAGAELIEKMTGRRPEIMPDPVLLVGREDWLSLAETGEDYSRYLVCYFLGDQPDYWTKVKEKASETGLQPLVIPTTAASCSAGLTVRPNVSVEAWLGLLAGAGAVMTDSFHGSAFAAIFHTPCCILRRWTDESKASKNSRIDQLMRDLSLPQDGIRVPADFEAADRSLAAMRTKAENYLQSVLKEL